ncbi:MAG: hypothetical protein ACRCXK_02540 [Wohlfahrtiimonas sp.]
MKPQILQAWTDVSSIALGSLSNDHRMTERLDIQLYGYHGIVFHVYVNSELPQQVLEKFGREDELNDAEALTHIITIEDGKLAAEDRSIVDTGREIPDTEWIEVPKGQYRMTIHPLDGTAMEEDDEIHLKYDQAVKTQAMNELGEVRYQKAQRLQKRSTAGCLWLIALSLVLIVLLFLLPWLYKLIALITYIMIIFGYVKLVDRNPDVEILSRIQQDLSPEYFYHYIVSLESLVIMKDSGEL